MTVVSKVSEMIGREDRPADKNSKSTGSGNEYKGPPPLIKIDLKLCCWNSWLLARADTTDSGFLDAAFKAATKAANNRTMKQ